LFFSYQVIITVILSISLLILIGNFITFKPLGSYGVTRRFTAATAPLVSVLVPARNEARNIASCLRSLLRQDYPNFEVIVLDDGSEDATEAIVESLAREDLSRRLRIVSGQELPPGWLGKNFACHQLSLYAEGDYLLFTDADTVHGIRAISSSIAALEDTNCDFLSIFPRQITESLAERLAVPLMLLYVVGLLPTWLVRRSKNAAFSAANGQYMFYRRAAYEAIGGHAAVREVILEDVIMGQRVKKAGFKQLLPDGTDTVSCRMYHSSLEVWNGFSKNIYAFFGFKLYWIILFLIINILVFIGPFFVVLAGWITQRPANFTWLWLPLAQIVMAWLIRLGIAVRFGFRGMDIFLHPLSIIYMVFIAINSVRWRKRGVQWKGRIYQ